MVEQVVVGDYDELRIPQESHRVPRTSGGSENLNQVDWSFIYFLLSPTVYSGIAS